MHKTSIILTPAFTSLLLCIVYVFLWITLCFHHHLPPLGIDVRNPAIDVTVRPSNVPYEGSRDLLSCQRVPVSGVSRLKLQHYASVYNITLFSPSIPKKWHTKIQVCFHRNSSLGLCQCEKDEWISLQNGLWVSTMSAYDQRFIDVKFDSMVTGSVTVTLKEVQQRWRYVLLGAGIVLLLLAPVVSEWVPFYYASSMVIGIITVVLILLYQARIFLPIRRRNAFYLSIMCSAIGAGSFVVHYFTAFVTSVLLKLGISPEIQNLMCYFVGLGIILLGAAIGYWLLRKFFISEDGEVHVGVAQFVKCSMFIVALTCIFLSPKDKPLATVALGCCLALYHVMPKKKQCYFQKTSPLVTSWSKTVVNGELSPLTKTGWHGDVYSTFHKTRNRKKLSKKEWEEFGQESTRRSLAELASSPEFSDWVVKNAGRIKLLDEDGSDDADGSESCCGNELSFSNWFMSK